MGSVCLTDGAETGTVCGTRRSRGEKETERWVDIQNGGERKQSLMEGGAGGESHREVSDRQVLFLVGAWVSSPASAGGESSKNSGPHDQRGSAPPGGPMLPPGSVPVFASYFQVSSSPLGPQTPTGY